MASRVDAVRKTHCLANKLQMKNRNYARKVVRFFADALEDDLGRGDITTGALLISTMPMSAMPVSTMPRSGLTRAELIARDSGILAGMEELSYAFKTIELRKFFGSIRLQTFYRDGQHMRKNSMIAVLTGQASAILQIERTILNFLQRMSGIATLTNKYVRKVPASILVVPTRKTLWGVLDKKACLRGGGGTHRLNLADAIMVKDTHLELLQHDFGKILKLLQFALLDLRPKGVPDCHFFEIEIEKFEDGLKLARLIHQGNMRFAKPLYVLLDNMSPALAVKTIAAMRKITRVLFFEISGGINLENIGLYAKTGADLISVGALTHSAPALDISLKIRPEIEQERS